MDFPPAYGSHLPLLAQICLATTGDVLELGTGINSTPFLHWVCFEMSRKLVSYESSRYFFRWAEQFKSETHLVERVLDWDAIPIERPWSVAFVDHAWRDRRQTELPRLADWAQFIVLHDSETVRNRKGGRSYEPILQMFKYRHDSISQRPRTTVVSNTCEIPIGILSQ